MITDRQLETFLLSSGYAAPSVEQLRPAFARWRRRLAQEGVENIPRAPHLAAPGDAHAVNLVCLLARQAGAVRDGASEHELRNLTGARPWKP